MDEKLEDFREWLCDEWEWSVAHVKPEVLKIIDEFDERFGA